MLGSSHAVLAHCDVYDFDIEAAWGLLRARRWRSRLWPCRRRRWRRRWQWRRSQLWPCRR
eukprot:6951027-Alexandrium_andersonii.AAC.1